MRATVATVRVATTTDPEPTARCAGTDKERSTGPLWLLGGGSGISLLGLTALSRTVLVLLSQVLGTDLRSGPPSAVAGPTLAQVPMAVWGWLLTATGAPLLVSGLIRLALAARRRPSAP